MAEQMAAVKGGQGGGLTVHQEQHFHFQGIDGRSIQQMLHEQKGTIAKITADAVRQSYGFRREIQGGGR